MSKGFPIVDYNKKEINKAGEILANSNSLSKEINYAQEIIDEWRASHYYPISTIQASLRTKARSVYNQAIIVQRLKKMQSIKRKLEYNSTLTNTLSNMQDIGGCRVIMTTKESVFELSEILKRSTWKHKLVRENDYINSPKSTGYRGIHLVYEYYSKNNISYNGMQIEIQIRTNLQHIWATAVETVGVFTNNELKSNKGDENWKRFFALVSSLFAIEENAKCIPHTSHNSDEILCELNQLNKKYKFCEIINKIHTTVNFINESNLNVKENDFYLLSLENNDKKVEIIKYNSRDRRKANQEYLRMEKSEDKNKRNVVLVSASSIENLKKAYPNYFMNIEEFYNAIMNYLDK